MCRKLRVEGYFDNIFLWSYYTKYETRVFDTKILPGVSKYVTIFKKHLNKNICFRWILLFQLNFLSLLYKQKCKVFSYSSQWNTFLVLTGHLTYEYCSSKKAYPEWRQCTIWHNRRYSTSRTYSTWLYSVQCIHMVYLLEFFFYYPDKTVDIQIIAE